MGLAAILTLIISALVLSNLVGRNYSSQLNDSFDALYKDRLLAANYLYGINNALHEKHDLLLSGRGADGQQAVLAGQNALIAERVSAYNATTLTKEEAKHWMQFNRQMTDYDRLEKRWLAGDDVPMAALHALYRQNQQTLQQLTDLQATEGRNLRKNSRTILLNDMALGKAEITLLIVLGLLAVAISTLADKGMFGPTGRHQLN
jgi:hypothetical protein